MRVIEINGRVEKGCFLSKVWLGGRVKSLAWDFCGAASVEGCGEPGGCAGGLWDFCGAGIGGELVFGRSGAGLGVRGGAKTAFTVDFLRPLVREADSEAQRRVFLAMAMDQGRRLGVKYWSVNISRGAIREIAPHALGHDRYRRHVRAWCFENS